MSNSAIKLICPNKDCINKSPVFRRFDYLKEYSCKACGTSLVRYKPVYAVREDKVAKKQLNELGIL